MVNVAGEEKKKKSQPTHNKHKWNWGQEKIIL